MLRHLRYISILASLMVALSAFAQPHYNTTGDQYYILTKDDLRYVMDHPDMWSKNLVQLEDIDFGGETITPIGIGSTVDSDLMPFTGNYDGRGHSVSNAVILWDNYIHNSSLGFGFFGYIGGTSAKPVNIKGLTLNNIHITRSDAAKNIKHAIYDVRIGVFAAAINNFVKITDICVINSRIDDGGKDTDYKAMMIGGFIGNIGYGYGGTSEISTTLVCKNIFCDVDIDLSHAVRMSAADTQANLGGIIGRIRTPASLQMIPENTIYTGSIKAPSFYVSPTVGAIRHTADVNNTDAVRIYGGELKIKYKDPATNKDVTTLFTLEEALAKLDEINNLPRGTNYNDFCDKRLYYDYNVYDSETEAYKSITPDFPDPNENYAQKTRTLEPNANASDFFDYTKTKSYRYVQGHNFGKYTDPASDDPTITDRADILDLFNGAVTETVTLSDRTTKLKRYQWAWDATLNDFILVNNLSFENSLTPTISPNDNRTVYTANIFYLDTNCDFIDKDNGEFQWYSCPNIVSNSWSLLPEETSSTITNVDKSLFYKFTWTYKGEVFESGYIAPSNVIYVYNKTRTEYYNKTFTGVGTSYYDLTTETYKYDGNDANDGLTPQTALKTMAEAYSRLDVYGDVFSNKIVVMGFYQDMDFLSDPSAEWGNYSRPATITGTDNVEVYNGKFEVIISGFSINKNVEWYLQAPLRFDNIDLQRGIKSTADLINLGYFNINCNFYDITIDENVRFINFPGQERQTGLVNDMQTVAFTTIVGGYLDSNNSNVIYPSDRYPDYKGFYSEPGRTNIIVRSGNFGRLIMCNRNTKLNNNSRNIIGAPDAPDRVKLTVNIPNDIVLSHIIDADSTDLYNEYSKYGLKLVKNTGSSTYHYESAGYTHNIGLVAGGQTDGSVFADVEVNLYAGTFARVLTGNISFGRTTDSGSTKYPYDSFFGRSVVNIFGRTHIVDASDPNNIDVYSETTINEIYGGILGRKEIGSSQYKTESRPYFYGETTINMYGGFIGKYRGSNTFLDNIEPNIYAAGGGGVSGLGDDIIHTSDPAIPYIDNASGKLLYGDYNTVTTKGKLPIMTMYDGIEIDLSKTTSHVNLYSGIVEGSVYGAGYGYSNNFYAKTDAIGGTIYNQLDLYPGYPTADNPNSVSTIGNFYGDSYITMASTTGVTPAEVWGNVYGSGAGDTRFAQWYDTWLNDQSQHYISVTGTEFFIPTFNPFHNVATQYGKTNVLLEVGTVGNVYNQTGGDVYAGSMGISGYENIAALYGITEVNISGATIYGNIYGGSELANIRIHGNMAMSGSTNVNINSGTIGNNIFGGSKGIDDSVNNIYSKAIVEGNTNVTVNGGNFLGNPFINLKQTVSYDAVTGEPDINIVDNRNLYRTFNIYGGGYQNCDVKGDANVNVYSSLLSDDASFVAPSQNPNALKSLTVSNFQSAYMDITYRCFCVYGGGFGEKTNVMNTNVYVTIPRDRQHVSLPHSTTLDRFLDHQSFFDIAGGGYSGDIGYWVDKNGDRVTSSTLPADYDHYVGGACNVTIDDYTFARKVIGGGFYGSCRTTNTHIRCGSLRQVYGGSLLGYVHDRAYLQFGNRTEDFVRWNPLTESYVYNEFNAFEPFRGDEKNVSPSVWNQAAQFAKSLNDYIFITENIYGGNDVKGIIGTQKWEHPTSTPTNPVYAIDPTDYGPLYCTDIDASEEKGIVFNIYGGTFMGNVYGAGNGHYRGYYVPEWVRYNDGPARMYRSVRSSVGDKTELKNAYRSRPMVGSVNINLRGNSNDDYIKLHGDFFGGGRECTIGQFNTILPLEDPRRLVQGGHLHVNFGGYVNVDGNVYLGNEGQLYAQQQCVPSGIDVTTFDGSSTNSLETLGVSAYEHWYFNTEKNCYVPGYPAPKEFDGNFGMTGEHMFNSYMQNIQLQGDVELTFYRYLYERNDDDLYILDAHGDRIRKRWVPGEIAIDLYDAPSVSMNSFYLGGLSGSMTNNTLMAYCYDSNTSIDPNIENTAGHEHEKWGSIYRITLPRKLTIRDKVVMGSENATTRIYPYNADYTAVVTEDDEHNPVEPYYIYEGGLITQHNFSYDLIVYNDYNNSINGGDEIVHNLPEGFYTNEDYRFIYDGDKYTLLTGDDKDLTITRRAYVQENFVYNLNDIVKERRYSLAMRPDGTPYIGPRESRKVSDGKMTVTKLTAACKFDPQPIENAPDPTSHVYHYGGNIYGGCYNSGIVMGDVILNVGSNMLGDHLDESNASTFDDFSSLKYNIGRVFGGGFGKDTRIEGNTYVNLLHNFKGMNVFGGGMEGDVTGTAHITYIGTEKDSYVFGSIYGGGLRGDVGTAKTNYKSTEVKLYSGNVERVYGGSCMGNLYGRTFVELCDRVSPSLDHLDYNKLGNWGGSRLIAGQVFGGNDIAGNIYPLGFAPFVSDPVEDMFQSYTTGVYIHEERDESAASSGTGNTGSGSSTGSGSTATADEDGPGKTSPGSKNGYNGFPLIGDLYGGSNGNYGVQGPLKYTEGEVVIATGIHNGTKTISLVGMDVPHVDKSHIVINGGSIINGYGGGNMCNIRDIDKITVNYPELSMEARAGFDTEEDLERVWTVLHFSSDQQRDEVSETNEDGNPIFKYQIQRLFGGNNNADMNIQPTWNLQRGNIGSLYSGGNFGKMTFYQPKGVDDNGVPVEEAGLTLTIDSNDLIIDNVYGGGRVGDINPFIKDPTTLGEHFYGATLNIKRGIIEHVYGGNDVSGYVSYGTNVNLYGAISGDVYCAGNGNYLYRYDRDASLLDYSDPNLRIKEDYQFQTEDYKGARYFVLPAKAEYGYVAGAAYAATDDQVALAINSYRPNVERTRLFIEGHSTTDRVWVKGNVYCGGNSATVIPKSVTEASGTVTSSYDVEFDIGSNVILNGVFLGSNGASLSLGEMIRYTEKLNGIDMLSDNDLVNLTSRDANALKDPNDQSALDLSLYPKVLDLYMRAVESTQIPKNFDFDSSIEDVYIGEFCVGGNRGSMVTDKKIELHFPQSLIIFNHIIGGCKDANVTYNGYTHIGGLNKPLASDQDKKLAIEVRSKFRPLNLLYPDINSNPPISFYNYMVDVDGNEYKAGSTGDKYYHDQQCNIFGGCFTSGTTVGDVSIDVFSDMLNYECNDDTDEMYIDKMAVVNGINDRRSWRAFTIVGGGYGMNTAVYGNIDVRMLPELVQKEDDTDPANTLPRIVTHPSAATIFGGSQEGLVVGNTNVEIRDGKVLANVYGASEAAKMYGSTNVIVGYPKYYRALQDGMYRLNRTDYMSATATGNWREADGSFAVPKTVGYRAGDYVACNVHDMVIGRVNDAVADASGFEVGQYVAEGDAVLINASNIDQYFAPVKSSVGTTTHDHIIPEDFGVTWDDITIWVGDQKANLDPTATYYGHGNIYGGGFIPNSSDLSLIGENTILRFTPEFNMGESSIKYGGNTNVMIWDNDENADLSKPESSIRDHIHLGTGRFVSLGITDADTDKSKKGLFEKVKFRTSDTEPWIETYVYQTVGRREVGKEYFKKEADGGLYGGGRKVFAESFRTIDLAYYGYAEHTPQSPKLLNTIQRADVATITDCCMEMVGASDFTVDNFRNIYYAINRVGELRMISSLNCEDDLDPGVVDAKDGVRVHNKKRSRNYIALYNPTNHLAAFRSNWSFEKKYHDEQGAVTSQDESTDPSGTGLYGYPNEGKVSYVNRKHRYVDVESKLVELQRKKDDATYTLTNTDLKSYLDSINDLYENLTSRRIEASVGAGGEKDLEGQYVELSNAVEDLFRQRNLGTSGNMIGISSGYELSIEGLSCAPGKSENRYYGPAYGVTEIKLLTTVSGMGGGYVYALNHHYDPAVDGEQAGVETSEWCSKFGHDFLQTTGNFVFPGASYIKQVTDASGTITNKENHNFIIDDCFDHFDPMNHGYYYCENMGGHQRIISRDASTFDVNDAHEVHYWYVSGNTYTYNVTITGITSDTTPEKPRDFWLSNDNDIINLFNVRQGTNIVVTEVNWFEHEDDGSSTGSTDPKCDISDLEKQYQLYLILDHDTRNTATSSTDGAYVIRVPRFSYEMKTDASTGLPVNRLDNKADYAGVNVPTDGIIVDPNPEGNATVFGGTYTEEDGTTVNNKPRLGLRLIDGQRNRLTDEGPEAGTEYYNKYLKDEHLVQVIMETTNGTEETITYVINISIKYLMGPAIFGEVEIENCALPGEYIYVNADNVDVIMDENLGITEQKWRLYPNDANGNRIENPSKPVGETNPHIYYELNTPEFTTASEKLIHIPAYYYQNGWEVAYLVKANGEDFESTLPYYIQKPDPANSKKMIDTDVPDLSHRLQVHNYHRMKPLYNGNVLDLRLVEGARIYIEDEEDLKYYFEYLDMMQHDETWLAANTVYERRSVPLSFTKDANTGAVTLEETTVNPLHCAGLNFFLQKSGTVPSAAIFTPTTGTAPLVFAGRFHGNGNTMTVPSDAAINFKNVGNIYNTGIISLVDKDDSVIFDENEGTITNCFYFNTNYKGTLASGGTMRNCYQNTNAPVTVSSNQLMMLSTLGFRYGQVAYNLNGFYLQKRHKLLHDALSANNSFALEAKDTSLRGDDGYKTTYDTYAVDYIEKMFNDGDYRYALFNWDEDFKQFTEALRTADEPNYLDRFSQRNNNKPVTMHDMMHKVDTRRWSERDEKYHPLYDIDYLFFGENLTVNVDDDNEELPTAYNPSNRVYRVGGFYGSAADKGYFLNRKAFLDSPIMTAIDFVGYRDRDLYDTDGQLLSDYRTTLNEDGWLILSGRQEIFMAPTIDMPWKESAADPTQYIPDFESFRVNSDKVTHNLLIYTPDNDEVKTILSGFHYTDQTYGIGLSEHSFAEHSDDLITAHHIIDDGDGPKVYGDYFHLVDKHDFNAPVAFDIKQGWYNRLPQDYATTYTITDASGTTRVYKTAWEGICLPFNVEKVYAASTNSTLMRDMGEITHFFGEDDSSITGNWRGHEYWLRRFVGVSDDGTELFFQRPTTENVGSGTDLQGDYVYNNSAIYELYKDMGYDEPNIDGYTHDKLYHLDDPLYTGTPINGKEPRVINDYLYLSRSIPYLVTYPGESYYEFDLSGEFYAKKSTMITTAVPQSITYFANDDITKTIKIPVTDDVPLVDYTFGNYTFSGTFQHITDNTTEAMSVLYTHVDHLGVLDYLDLSSNTEKHHGTNLNPSSGNSVVLPFRTYLSSTKAITGTPVIASREGITEIIESDDPEEEPQQAEEAVDGIQIWAEGSALMIRTPYDVELYVFNSIGQVVRYIKAYEGVNRYTGLPSALYIVNGTKVLIRR